LTATVFYLLANPASAEKVKKEVKEAQEKSNTPLRYRELQQLPYLVL